MSALDRGENLALHIPPYLSEERQAGFLAALRAFPESRPLYTRIADPEPLQGDCWDGVVFLRYPTGESKTVRALLLSNSCDSSAQNQRLSPAVLSFVPVVRFATYEASLKSRFDETRVSSHLEDVRKQKYSSLFFMPAGAGIAEDSIALLDTVQSVPLKLFTENQSASRVSSLSDIGFYLFIFKLSYHFCRLHEAIDRTPIDGLNEPVS